MDASKVAWSLLLAVFVVGALLLVEPDLSVILPTWLRTYRPEIESVRKSPPALLCFGAALGWLAWKVRKGE